VTEYLEGTYKQERENLLSKIALAESELKRAEGWLVKSKKMVEEAKLARNRMVSAELAVQRVKLALEQSRMKRDTLEKYTKEKMVKKLQSAVEKARSDELAKQAAYGLARSAQERSQKQIENCRLLAPINGRLHYSKPIEEAADVREGQLLFRVVPEDEPKPGANPEPAEPKGDGVFNPVEGCSTIIAIKPEGSRVAKGELVCELDSSPLKVKLADQQAATKGAVAAYQNAQLVREVTEFAFDGYVYRLYKQDLLEVEGEVASAEVGRKRAEDELARLQRIHEKWGDGPSPIGHKLGLQQKIFALEQAQTRKRVLEAYTGPRMIEKLQRAIEEARSEESARKVALGREQEAEARLLKQLQLCNVFAPASGRLSFPRDIAKGASIREGQLLFRVVPEDDPK
jgi:multidrug resistance efflux pump